MAHAGGRPRKPTVLKEKQGTIRKDRTNALEPKYAIVKSIPDPPDHFNDDSRVIYYEVGLELSNIGILAKISFSLFLRYCYLMGECMNAEREIEKKGRVFMHEGKLIVNPYIKVLAQYLGIARQLASDFGLTPTTSSKVMAPKDQKSSFEEEFLK